MSRTGPGYAQQEPRASVAKIAVYAAPSVSRPVRGEARKHRLACLRRRALEIGLVGLAHEGTVRRPAARVSMNASRVDTGTWSKAPGRIDQRQVPAPAPAPGPPRPAPPWHRSCDPPARTSEAEASRPPAAHRRRNRPARTPAKAARLLTHRARGGRVATTRCSATQAGERRTPECRPTARGCAPAGTAGSPEPPSSTAIGADAIPSTCDHASTSASPSSSRSASAMREGERRKQPQDLGIARRSR